jgi:hypothetical protein
MSTVAARANPVGMQSVIFHLLGYFEKRYTIASKT